MKNFFKKTALFFLGFIVLYIMACVLIPREYFYSSGKVTMSQWYDSISEINSYSDADIVFVGSSHVYRSFDPAYFKNEKIKIFNLASPAQTPLNSYYALKEFIGNFNPKLVVLEVYPSLLGSDGLESFSYKIGQPSLSLTNLEETFTIKNMGAINTFFSELGKRVFLNDRVCVPTSYGTNCIFENYVHGGYDKSFVTHASDLKEQIKVIEDRDNLTLDESKKQMLYLEKCLQLLEEKGLKVLVVIQPVPAYYINATKNYYSVTEDINNIAKKYDTPFIDFSGKIALDGYADYYDTGHLNQDGVKKFDSFFIKTIREEGLVR